MSDELKPPIILFGNFRSGTTMLQKVIATHPGVVPLYEPVGLWLSADPSRSHDEFGAEDATDKVKKYIRGQFLKLQRESGNRVVVEKTPHNILRIPYVRAIFPEAHFLYVVRNPLSFVSSVEIKWQRPAGHKRIMKRLRTTPPSQVHHYLTRFLTQQWHTKVLRRKYLPIWGPRYRGIQQDVKNEDLLTVIARQWARSASKADADLAQFDAGQVLRLRYEDFVQDPIADLERICNHCGLDLTPEMTKTVAEMVKTDRTHKWQRFDAEQLARLVPELAAEMTRNRYEVPEQIADVLATRSAG